MKRSKLELYEDVLLSLSKKSSTIDEIAYRSKMDCILLEKRIEFLIVNNLIEERSNRTRTFFCLTQRGKAVINTLTIAKRLQRLQIGPQKS